MLTANLFVSTEKKLYCRYLESLIANEFVLADLRVKQIS